MPHRYLLFYKPFDVLCQFTNPDGLACPTLKDFIDVPDVYSVGRLDRDSEGLLLLTDHGAMKHRLTHPQFQHPRTYWVQVERCPDDEALAQLRSGVMIKGGYQTLPARVSRLEPVPQLPPRVPPIRFRKTVPTAWLSLTLTEGRNRQVRRMTAAVGHPTLRLVRVGMGAVQPGQAIAESSSQTLVQGGVQNVVQDSALGETDAPLRFPEAGLITLHGLQPGEWRALSPVEVEQLPSIWGTGRSPTARGNRQGRSGAAQRRHRRASGHRSGSSSGSRSGQNTNRTGGHSRSAARRSKPKSSND